MRTALSWTPSSVCRTITNRLRCKMITAGLVARDVDSADRRASVVTLTEAGREKLATWTTAHERRIDVALAALDDTERAAITNALPALFQLAENLGESADGASQG
jgi:DNA-binding MarR family transcriptional regulator